MPYQPSKSLYFSALLILAITQTNKQALCANSPYSPLPSAPTRARSNHKEIFSVEIIAEQIKDIAQHKVVLGQIEKLDTETLTTIASNGYTLLMIAVQHYNNTSDHLIQSSVAKIITQLCLRYRNLELAADTQDARGNTALHYAQNIAIAGAILTTGVNALINITNNAHETAYDIAKKDNLETLAHFLEKNSQKKSGRGGCCIIS
jgi:hypothetical protein